MIINAGLLDRQIMSLLHKHGAMGSIPKISTLIMTIMLS